MKQRSMVWHRDTNVGSDSPKMRRGSLRGGWFARGVAAVTMGLALAIGAGTFSAEAAATQTTATGEDQTYYGSNVEAQNYEYDRWASPVNSYLTYSNGTYMRVQADASSSGYLVEYYDSSFVCQSSRLVAKELSLFGAFYQAGDYYYILSGQTNSGESDSVEVYRITKYDKSWNRLGSCSLYGANTTVPFDAGSARMASYGDYLLIRTCHEMYKSDDGNNHQANVTIQVDTSTMTVVDAAYEVKYVDVGYVSHSFNQFIQIENGKVVAVDHGDAYPRSIVLVQAPNAVSANGFTQNTYKKTEVIKFAGTIGANYTGASINGFEISDSSYLIVGCQDVNTGEKTSYDSSGRDVFVAAVSKSDNSVTVNKLTDNAATKAKPDTPQFVKLDTDSYMVLWHVGTTVYYAKVDGTGKLVGSVSSMTGDLSDCAPILAGGKVVWYTWSSNKVVFYQIDVTDASSSGGGTGTGTDNGGSGTDANAGTGTDNSGSGTDANAGTGTDNSGSGTDANAGTGTDNSGSGTDANTGTGTDNSGSGTDANAGTGTDNSGSGTDANTGTGTDNSDTGKETTKASVKKTKITKIANTSSGVRLTWKKVSGGVSGYIIYRKTSAKAGWKKIKTVAASKTGYTDKSVKSKNGKTYIYKIVTYKKENGKTVVRASSKQKKIVRLVTPSKVKASNVKSKKLKVSWKKKTGISGYQIQYSTSKTFVKSNKMVKVSKKLTKKTIPSLKKGKTYYVRVRTYKKTSSGTVYSAWSSKKAVRIKK